MQFQKISLSICIFSSAAWWGVLSYAQDRISPDSSTVYYGVASYYGVSFNGQQTANGDIFDVTHFTAASNLLPMDQYVLVTNLHNHRKAVVKINDRMASGNQRLIDVSEAVARRLGFRARGITRVKVQLIPGWVINWFDLAALDTMQQLDHR
ncbi:MAG: septal ring lytic transglycosylase RlpA family protein [Thermoflavifilum sp.]|nr:septal ring lytic transglycosylase RlpA family protein [Thermoflavifilum sp.]